MTTTRCTYCGHRAEQTYLITRKGGGTYNRAGRSYTNQLCAACVRHLLEGTESRASSESTTRYNIGSLRRIAARIAEETADA